MGAGNPSTALNAEVRIDPMIPEFGIWPQAGEQFDVSKIIDHLENHPKVVAVPPKLGARYHRTNPPDRVYVICPTRKRAEDVREWVRAGNTVERFMASCGIIEATSGYISVLQMAPEEVVREIKAVLLPFLRKYRWKLYSEDGDISNDFKHKPEDIFNLRKC